MSAVITKYVELITEQVLEERREQARQRRREDYYRDLEVTRERQRRGRIKWAVKRYEYVVKNPEMISEWRRNWTARNPEANRIYDLTKRDKEAQRESQRRHYDKKVQAKREAFFAEHGFYPPTAQERRDAVQQRKLLVEQNRQAREAKRLYDIEHAEEIAEARRLRKEQTKAEWHVKNPGKRREYKRTSLARMKAERPEDWARYRAKRNEQKKRRDQRIRETDPERWQAMQKAKNERAKARKAQS